jgi:beta-galactosidase
MSRVGEADMSRVGEAGMSRVATAQAPRTGARWPRLAGLAYGADYNPEQWPEEVWLEDVRLMREAGVNLVSVGIFSWSRIQPAPEQWDFGWLDRVIDLLHEHGVAVDLGTPTASPPAWLVRSHPGILPVTADGVTLGLGSRRHYCPHSEAYRDHALRVARALGERYGDHPALVLWHVDNEYACHVTECFCEASAAGFRAWLRARYGDLAALNEAWGTEFWSQAYGDWEEIAPPGRAPTFLNPSQLLDWRRFWSDSWRECFTDQASVLRAMTPEIPVTTNFMGFHKPIDYWTVAREEDVVANDAYPDTSAPEWMIDAGMVCDLMRSLGGGQPWMLMEQAAAHVNWRQRNATKRPGVMRLGSYQAVARGADAVMFFQWRASRAGAERFHSAMIPHGGPSGRTWREVTGLGGELAQLGAIAGSRVEAQVGILFDWESWWALETPGKPSHDVRQLPLVRDWYAGLFRRGITADFAHPAADLSRYRLVIAPSLYLVDDAAAANLRDWVADGGTLVMSFFSGIVDRNDHVRLGGYPAALSDLLGLVVDELVPYADGQSNRVRSTDGATFESDLWADVVHLEGAEALGEYTADFHAGIPAITLHRFGQGSALYVGTRLEDPGTAWVIERACQAAGVPFGAVLPAGVEVVRRSDGSHGWSFVLNYSEDAVEVPIGQGPPVSVGPRDIAVISG